MAARSTLSWVFKRPKNLRERRFLHKRALWEKGSPKREEKPPKGPRRQNPTQVAFLIKELRKGALWQRGRSQNGKERKKRNPYARVIFQIKLAYKLCVRGSRDPALHVHPQGFGVRFFNSAPLCNLFITKATCVSFCFLGLSRGFCGKRNPYASLILQIKLAYKLGVR